MYPPIRAGKCIKLIIVCIESILLITLTFLNEDPVDHCDVNTTIPNLCISLLSIHVIVTITLTLD